MRLIISAFLFLGTILWVQASGFQFEEFKINLDELTTPIVEPDGFGNLKIEHVKADKIVQGFQATSGQFPYQAAVFFARGGHIVSFCGGSLISTNTILTAAHCVHGMSQAVVCMGCINLNANYEQGRQLFAVRESSSLKAHKDYDSSNIRNDVAVIKLPAHAIQTAYVKVVPLAPSSSSTFEGFSTTISGWGKTRDSDQGITPIMRYINVRALELKTCKRFYSQQVNYQIREYQQICTEATYGRSTCNGDSGGPLVITDSSGKAVQIGIVSFGINYCEKKAPSVYTRVSAYNSWITSHL